MRVVTRTCGRHKGDAAASAGGAVKLEQGGLEVGCGDRTAGDGDIYGFGLNARGVPVFIPSELQRRHKRPETVVRNALSECVEHAGREVGGDDGMPVLCERDGERTCPTSHVEHALTTAHICQV